MAAKGLCQQKWSSSFVYHLLLCIKTHLILSVLNFPNNFHSSHLLSSCTFPCVSYNRGNPNLLTFELFVIIYLSESLWCWLIAGEVCLELYLVMWQRWGMCRVTVHYFKGVLWSRGRHWDKAQTLNLNRLSRKKSDRVLHKEFHGPAALSNINNHRQACVGNRRRRRSHFSLNLTIRSHMANKNVINTFFKLPHFSAKCHFKGVDKITDNADSIDLRLSCSSVISMLSLLWLSLRYIISWQHLDTSE